MTIPEETPAWEQWEAVVHPSLAKPILEGGVGRTVILLEFCLGYIAAAMQGFTVLSSLITILIVCIIHQILRYLTSKDPLVLVLLEKSVQYLPFYPARATRR